MVKDPHQIITNYSVDQDAQQVKEGHEKALCIVKYLHCSPSLICIPLEVSVVHHCCLEKFNPSHTACIFAREYSLRI